MKRILFSILAVWAVVVGDSALAKEGDKRYLNLTVGITQEESVTNMPSSIVGNENYNRNVVRISVAKDLKKVRFEPQAPGKTNFILTDEKGKKIVEFYVTVGKNNLNAVANEIKGLLSDIEGIQVKLVNGKVVIDGEILLPRDMNRIYSVVSQFGDVASSLVTMSPLAQKKIAELIERDIGNPEVHVRAVNEKFILEGVASNDGEKQKAVIIAKTYVPDVIVEAAESAGVIKKRKIDSVIDLMSVKPAPEAQPGKIIKLIVHYVELQKDYTKGFRFQWTPTLKEDSGVTFSAGSKDNSGIISQITGTVNDLLPKLNWAKAHGHARVLQSSSVIVLDGNAGIIKSVTRIPYTVQNQYGQLTTSFEEAGIDTQITPMIISAKSDSISLTINFSLKSLIGETEKGPLVSNSTIQTKVIVRNTQSAAIGGLVSSNSSAAYNRLPKGASENPIISLYASKQFQKNQSQFVVFITPVIMNSASEGSEDVKKKFRLKE